MAHKYVVMFFVILCRVWMDYRFFLTSKGNNA